jgi:diacylglycerol kinase family enzyme
MPITVDGEIAATTPATIRVLPGAVWVFVPRQFLRSINARPA